MPNNNIKNNQNTKRNDDYELGFSTCPTDGTRLDCYDSRPKDSHRWRRYVCPECGTRTTTYEILQTEYDQLVRKHKRINNIWKSMCEVLYEK